MALPMLEGRFDAAAYLAWEETQEERHEYIAGEVFAMVGVRQSHNLATLNLATLLRRELKGSPCRVFVEAVKTRVEAADCFFYPDVVVTCDPRDRLTPDYVSHPLLVAEVLSESTAAFDRGRKFAAYRKLEVCRTLFWSTWRRSGLRSFAATSRIAGSFTTTVRKIRSSWPRSVCTCRWKRCSKTPARTLPQRPRRRPLSHERHPQPDSVRQAR
jgi:Uma2 family endonuclease